MNNIPAFPCQEMNADIATSQLSEGMTLRDYFAGQALNALLSRDAYQGAWSKEKGVKRVVEFSYEYADEMLKKRLEEK